MSETIATLWSEAERQAWRLPEEIMVSQWADRYRILPADTAEPGPYRSGRTPYMRGPMDAFCDPEVEQIDVMSGSQIGKSCAIQNMIGYIIDQDPAPTLYVVPRERDVDYASQKVFKEMVRLSPALKGRISDSPRDLQTDFFTFDRMTLYFGWAGSPAEMAQKAIKNLFFDEPDKYPPFSGKEANPIDLAVKRTRTFWDRKIVKMCTPTTKSGYIYSSYSQSNMQQYYNPCPRCGEYQIWKFGQLKIPPKLRKPDEIRKNAGEIYYECEFCGHKIREERKEELVAAGLWVPEGQQINADGNIKGTAERSRRHSGFQISSFVSPFPGVSWPEIFIDWFRANTEEGIAIGKLLDFQNATVGVPFEETGKKIKTTELRKLRGGFSKGTVPGGCLILVAGVDYHKSRARGIVRIDYEIRGFGCGMRNYVISSGSVASFEKLDEQILLSPFPWADGTPADKRPWLAVMVVFVDSGYEPDEVYEYCRQRPGLTIPTKGEPGPRLKPLQPSDLETATERRLASRHRARYKGMQLLIVDTSYFKDQVTSWVEPRLDEEDKIIAEPLTSFYNEIPQYYLTEFANEQKVRVRDRKGNSRWVWKTTKSGAATHSLDTAVLCAAAAYYKGVHYLRDPEKAKQIATPAAVRPKPQKKTRRPTRGGFLDDLPSISFR